MSERLNRTEAAVDDLRESVVRLEKRIAALERGEPRRTTTPLAPEKIVPGSTLASDIQGPFAAAMGTPTLVGRSFLVLAGAFLLRVLTERGILAPAVGVAAGLAFAAVWIVMAAKAATAGKRASAGFYAACSAVIVGPLLLEGVTSFDVLSPTVGVATLALMTAGGLVVAARWRLQSAAWIFAVAAIVTAAAIATVRPPGEAATAFLVVLGVAVYWLADARDWAFLKWVTAFAANLAVLRLTAIAVAAGTRPESFDPVHPPVVAALHGSLVLGYGGTVVMCALSGRRALTLFDFVQTALAWIVGWSGVVQLCRCAGWRTSDISIFAVVAGIAAYGAAFGIVDRRQGRNRAFIYLSSLGLGLVLIGLPGAIGPQSGVVWSIAALAVATVGSRWDRVTLRVHAAFLLAAAWVVSGLGENIVRGLAGRAVHGVSVGAVVVAILTVLTTAVVLVGRRLRSSSWIQRLPLTGLLAMSALVVARGIALGSETILGPGTVGVAGTIALSAITVGLAFLAARGEVFEAGWLVYPYLAVTGVRMMAVDLSADDTLVLVFALTAYGTALIVSTWLLRKARAIAPSH